MPDGPVAPTVASAAPDGFRLGRVLTWLDPYRFDTVLRPEYRVKTRENATPCEGLRNTTVLAKLLIDKNLRVFRHGDRSIFPSWTSRVRIPSPAIPCWTSICNFAQMNDVLSASRTSSPCLDLRGRINPYKSCESSCWFVPRGAAILHRAEERVHSGAPVATAASQINLKPAVIDCPSTSSTRVR